MINLLRIVLSLVFLVTFISTAWADDDVNDFYERAHTQIKNLGKKGRAEKASDVKAIGVLLQKLDQLGIDLDNTLDKLKAANNQQEQQRLKHLEETEKAEIKETEDSISPMLAKLNS